MTFIAPPWTRRREALRRLARRPAADPVLLRWHRWAYAHDHVFFVQIGSNDGRRSDPLRVHLDRQPWRGVMVEPQPDIFALLRGERSDPRFELIQAAVTDHDGTVTITTFGEDRSHLATLSPTMVDGYKSVGLEPTAVEVPAMTFATLTRYVERIDVLHVDTEGHDAVILEQVDFDAWAIGAVLFEHAHLGRAEYGSLVDRLHAHGFSTWANGGDTLGLRTPH
jgi:FkbM family methyltransferase